MKQRIDKQIFKIRFLGVYFIFLAKVASLFRKYNPNEADEIIEFIDSMNKDILSKKSSMEE